MPSKARTARDSLYTVPCGIGAQGTRRLCGLIEHGNAPTSDGLRDTRRERDADRQAAKRPNSQKGKAFRLDGIPAPAHIFGHDRLNPRTMANGVDQGRVSPSSAAEDEACRQLRPQVERFAYCACRERRQCRGTILQANPSAMAAVKSSRSSDLGSGAVR